MNTKVIEKHKGFVVTKPKKKQIQNKKINKENYKISHRKRERKEKKKTSSFLFCHVN